MSTTNRHPTNILSEIVTWSQGLPEWQRDALRRIVEKKTLSATDIDDLTAACRAVHGLHCEKTSVLEPLTAAHLPTGVERSKRVTLCSVSNPENVNAIDSTQTLSFAPAGLTVIFGYNGSGKSGYGRVLRRACRARSKGDAILPNVMQAPPSQPASAVFTFAIDGVGQPPEQWVDGKRPVNSLGSISFFDSECASIHVRGKNDVAFTPFGLDVLPALATACKSVQEKLDSERKALEGSVPHFLKSTHATGATKVAVALRGLNATTPIEQLEKLASLNELEKKRLIEIPALLAADPQKLAKELRTRAGRIEALRATLSSASLSLSDEAINGIKTLATESQIKAKAAQVAAQANFADDPLNHIGDATWRHLWESARKYSEIVYPTQEYPVTTGDGSVCVLCQQPLGDQAKHRLVRFENFVRDESAKQASDAKEALQSALRKVREIGLLGGLIDERLKEVEANSIELHARVKQELSALVQRLQVLEIAHNSNDWEFALPNSLCDINVDLLSLVSSLNANANEAEKSADKDGRQHLETELLELKAAEWLNSVLGDIKDHQGRLQKIDKLVSATKDTRTNAITAKSKELAKLHVTDQLRDAFATEIRKMEQGVRRLNVELAATAGEAGASYYRVNLLAAHKADIGAIVSEGEHRCIALAGFLSELSTESGKSAIVFDDPTTSLDHRWRECFAKRLVDEANERQVIVFTHDVVLLHDLWGYAEENCIEINLLRVQSRRDNCGYVEDGVPWIAQRVSSRVDELEKQARGTRASFEAHDDDAYEGLICSVYNNLRSTIERSVEEKFFSGVVTRHKDYVNLKNLRKMTAVTADQCERLQNLFNRCCDITSAHDRAALRSFGIPTPDQALSDIQELRKILNDVSDAQKGI